MKGAAEVADDGFNFGGTMLTPAASVISAALAGTAVWITQRLVGKAAFQTAINNGFRDLMVAQQDQIKVLRTELEEERKQADHDRMMMARDNATLRGQVANLTQTIEGLKRLMRENGWDAPPAPIAPSHLIELRQDNLGDPES